MGSEMCIRDSPLGVFNFSPISSGPSEVGISAHVAGPYPLMGLGFFSSSSGPAQPEEVLEDFAQTIPPVPKSNTVPTVSLPSRVVNVHMSPDTSTSVESKLVIQGSHLMKPSPEVGCTFPL